MKVLGGVGGFPFLVGPGMGGKVWGKKKKRKRKRKGGGGRGRNGKLGMGLGVERERKEKKRKTNGRAQWLTRAAFYILVPSGPRKIPEGYDD